MKSSSVHGNIIMVQMVRTSEAYNAIVDVLISDTREWTIQALYEHLTRYTFGIDIAEYTVRRAVALLPQDCITRIGKRIIVKPRVFVRTPELVQYIEQADEGMHIPLLLNDRRRMELRRAFVLANDYALHCSIQWAADGGALEYTSGYGNLFVRAIH
jgi:hypothetical protein